MAILNRSARIAIRSASLLAALVIGSPRAIYSQARAPSEYQIKAVFLFHFTQFVEWPTASTPNQGPFVIGVLGEDPFGTFLDETVKNERAGGRELSIRRYRSAADIGDCQMLFISRSEGGRLAEVLDALKGKSVLTVGDSEDFARRGGMIRFVTDRGKVHLRVNVDAARDGNLTISSKLLRSAEIIHRGES
jgi:hypothetical protein